MTVKFGAKIVSVKYEWLHMNNSIEFSLREKIISQYRHDCVGGEKICGSLLYKES